MYQKIPQVLCTLLFAWQLSACAPSDSGSSASLRSLALSTGELVPEFNSSTTQYKAYVGDEVSIVDVLAYARDSQATVSINENVDIAGSDSAEVTIASATNTIVTVTVTSHDNAVELTYFVTLIKGQAPTDGSSAASADTPEPDIAAIPDAGTSDTGASDNTGEPTSDNTSETPTDVPDSTEPAAADSNRPITWQAVQRVKSGDVESGALFGTSMAASDDYFAAGSPGASRERGSVDVFQRSGDQWDKIQTLTENTDKGSRFGERVAISGDTLVVSAPGSNRVFTYQLQQGKFSLMHDFVPIGANRNERFGQSLALDGNTLAISNLRVSGVNGEVRIYRMSDKRWSYEQSLTDSDLGVHDEYANALALQGDLLAVSSFAPDAQCQINSGDAGSVKLFQRSGSNWQHLAKLTANDADGGDRFGYSIALNGGRLVVGSQCEDGVNNHQPSRGAAYVFQRTGNQWQQSAKLTASSGVAHSLFGDKVLALENQIIVSASYESSSGIQASGAAYVFNLDGNQWRQTDTLRASNSGAYDRFGWGMASNNNTLFIAAPQEDSPDHHSDSQDSVKDSGSVYVFR